MPCQLSYSRILHEEDLLVVRSNNYQCRLQQLTAIDFWCSAKFETQTIEVSHYDGAHADAYASTEATCLRFSKLSGILILCVLACGMPAEKVINRGFNSMLDAVIPQVLS
jgi:hypothetical protein